VTSMEDTRSLGTALALNSVGDGGFFVAGAVAFHELLGRTPGQIGLALTLAWTVGFLLTPPVGRLADRVGLRTTAVGLCLATAAATALLPLTRGPVVFGAVLVAYAVAQSGLHAVRQAMVVVLVPAADRTRVRGGLQRIANAGIGAGALVGGVALAAGTTPAYVTVFVLDALGFLAAALVTAGLPRLDRPPTVATTGGVWRDRPYLTVAGLTAVLLLYLPMLSVVLPLFVTRRTDAPAAVVAAVFAVNTVGVIALQAWAGRRSGGTAAAARSVRAGGLLLAASCVVFAAAGGSRGAVVAALVVLAGAVVQVVGEVATTSGGWELGFGLADPDRPGEWQGAWSTGIPVARALGPLLLVWLVVEWTGPGWLVLAAVFTAAALAVPVATGAAARAQAASRA
jgi:hypothetical protein